MEKIVDKEKPTLRRRWKVKGRENRIRTRTRYPHVDWGMHRRKQKTPEKIISEIKHLHSIGWNINLIAKEYGLDWHSVKMMVDEDYRKKRSEMSTERIKRILDNPIERKKQFARVDKCRKERMKNDSKYKKWVKIMTRKAGRKYEETHREERRVKALERYYANRDEINRKRRERRMMEKQYIRNSNRLVDCRWVRHLSHPSNKS